MQPGLFLLKFLAGEKIGLPSNLFRAGFVTTAGKD